MRCDVYQNNTAIQYDAVSASGSGAAVGVAPLSFHTADTDVISICEYVEIGTRLPAVRDRDLAAAPIAA